MHRGWKMATQITVRLQDELSRNVSGAAKRLHVRRSDIVRMALENFIGGAEDNEEGVPYDRVKNLLGRISTGVPDRGESHRKYLIERMRKHAKHPA